MKRYTLALTVLLGGTAVCMPKLAAQEGNEGARPLTFEAAYAFDAFSNTMGGVEQGTRFLDNVDVTLTTDLEALLGWRGATVFLYGLGNQGESPSELIGDAQTVSNIDAPTSWRLYEAWIEQNLMDGRASLRAGLYDLNSEFDAIETAGLFLNSSHGIGPDFSQTGLNGPSIFPITSLGFRASFALSEGLTIQGVILDGVPGDPENPTGTSVHLSREDGALMAGEVGYVFGAKSDWLPQEIRVAVGGYFYTRDFECILPPEAMENGPDHTRTRGFYALAEGSVYTEYGTEDQGASLFVRTGFADEAVNQFSNYLGGGVVYTGFFPGRDEDQLGLAVASAINGGHYKYLQSLNGTPVDGAEVAIELTYLAEFWSGFSIQPDIQYIVNPGTDQSLGNALAVGLRTGVAF